jgi:LysR family transcriptional regulator, transcriptional activator of nhaA
MDWLNYHHLFYFWTVAKEGSIARATSKLGLAQPTISAQLKALERSLGEKLFERAGRGLVLTEIGRTVLRYAEEIFTLGHELTDAVKDRPRNKPVRFEVGVSQVIPMLLVEKFLRPVCSSKPDHLRLICREGRLSDLLPALAIHDVDLVLADQPADPAIKVKAFSHLLGECGVSFFAGKRHRGLVKGFPGSLHAAPFLVPGRSTWTFTALEQWFEAMGIQPTVVGEFEDVDLLQVFGRRGMGVFTAPTIVEREVCRQFDVAAIGRTDKIRERFFAISVERKLRHPAVVTLTQAARSTLFDSP